MRLVRWLRILRQSFGRFGALRTLVFALYRAVNRVLFLECFHVVLLQREHLVRPPTVDEEEVSFRFATLAELRALSGRAELGINEVKLRGFLEGDVCLLQYVGQTLAGYTWVHPAGRPLLIPGLRLKLPRAFLYNYASLTLPQFRGRGHQAQRHHELLRQPQWRDRVGLIGYVRDDNWSSRQGLSKSGYRELGRIWMLGRPGRFLAWIPKGLRALGVGRLPAEGPGSAEPSTGAVNVLERSAMAGDPLRPPRASRGAPGARRPPRHEVH